MKVSQVNTYPRKICVYAGRFQPMHPGHYEVYLQLIEEFGKNNVFIATSNKTEYPNSPFTFENKKLIATKLFDIPESQIVQVKSPYHPVEILSSFNKDKDIYIAVLGEKDSERLDTNKYFKPYNEEDDLLPFSEQGYVKVVNLKAKGLNASQIRKVFRNSTNTETKKEIFAKIYGKFDEEIFKFYNEKLN